MFTFELLTPDGIRLCEDMDMVIAPGVEGDIGILEGHMNLVSRLRQGMIVATNQAKDTNRAFFVNQGFIEVTGDRVSIMASRIADLHVALPAAIDTQIEASEDDEQKEWLLALKQITNDPPYPIKR